MHVVRPDRVYRTGVLTPIGGYQPQVDVQSVAMAFTQGPPLGTMLRGHGLNGLRAWWESLKARFRVNRAVADGKATLVQTSPGPASMEAAVVAPQMQSQMSMLAFLTQSANAGQAQGPMAAAMFALQSRRPFTYYRAG